VSVKERRNSIRDCLSARGVLGPVTEKQTYANLLYLVVSFPLGIVYLGVLLFGFVAGLVSLPVVVGVAILIGTALGSRHLARFERWLAGQLLTVQLREPSSQSPADGTVVKIKQLLDAPETWRGLGFLALKFWLGIIGLVLVVFLWNAVELLTAPLRYPLTIEFGTVNDQPVAWAISTLPEALLAVPMGVGLGLVFLHLSNGFAYVTERIAIALLDGE
jgi:hypothetical protein